MGSHPDRLIPSVSAKHVYRQTHPINVRRDFFKSARCSVTVRCGSVLRPLPTPAPSLDVIGPAADGESGLPQVPLPRLPREPHGLLDNDRFAYRCAPRCPAHKGETSHPASMLSAPGARPGRVGQNIDTGLIFLMVAPPIFWIPLLQHLIIIYGINNIKKKINYKSLPLGITNSLFKSLATTRKKPEGSAKYRQTDRSDVDAIFWRRDNY